MTNSSSNNNDDAYEEYYRNLPMPTPTTVPKVPTDKKQASSNKSRKHQEIIELRELIAEVECKELRNRIKVAMEKVINSWTERHDALVDALNKLEQTRQNLKLQLSDQSQAYERCLRQYQHSKARYEMSSSRKQQKQLLHRASQSSLFSNTSSSSDSIRRRSLLLSSNMSCLSGRSGHSVSSSSSSRLSYASSVRTSTISLGDDYVESIASVLHGTSSIIDGNSVDPGELDNVDIFQLLTEMEELMLALSSPSSFKPLLSPRMPDTPSTFDLDMGSANNNEYEHEKNKASFKQLQVQQSQPRSYVPQQLQPSESDLYSGCYDGSMSSLEPLISPREPDTSSANDNKYKLETNEALLEQPQQPQAQRYKAQQPQPSENDLSFGCCDGFWQTIARGRGNRDEVSRTVINYLRRGGDPNVAKSTDTELDVKKGYSLLHAVVAVKNTAAIRKLVEAGVKGDVYPRTSKKEDIIAPVVLAAKLGYRAGISLLTKRTGADLMLDRGPFGETALHAAVQSGSEETVRFILRVTENKLVDYPDIRGASALHYASITGNVGIIAILVNEGQCNIDARDNKGETAIHYAVRNIQPRVIWKLVGDFGADPNFYILKKTKTPLDLAKMGDLVNIAAYLKSQGAKTTKQLEKEKRVITVEDKQQLGDPGTVPPSLGVKRFLQTKTSQILRGTF